MLAPPPPPPPACIAKASARYTVPRGLLRGILRVEAGGRDVVHRNRNGSEDLGWMQINTLWLPTLAQWHITRDDLLTRPCLNIAVGAWILRGYWLRFDHDWARAIRAYNVGPDLSGGYDYARQVIVTWRRLSTHERTSQ